MTSAPRPHAAPHAVKYARLALGLLVLAIGCGNDDGSSDNPDGSFGTGAGNYPRDAGMDGAVRDMDSGATNGGPVVSVRFMHAIPNTGALLVCHDPDGPGPIAASALSEAARVMSAEFGTRSASLRLPALSSGVLTLQRTTLAGDGGVDAGVSDGGVQDPCDPFTREATIPLPISGQWLSPRAPLNQMDFEELDLLPSFVAGTPSITLLGTGVALNPSAVEQRAQRAHADALPSGEEAASDAESLARAALAAAFGPRTLIQPDRQPAQPDGFTLAVLHAVPDVPPASDVPKERQVGALRVCITAGTRNQSAFPEPPAPGIPFRVRSEIGGGFDPRLSYEFRAYAQADFDARKQDCASTSLSPVARGSYADFAGGHAYTLAIIGALAPSSLCGADPTSLVRASCDPPPAQLNARIEVLAD